MKILDDFITEKHLQILWHEKRMHPFLTTSEEKSIEVISTGTWNHKKGPDFLHAHIRIGTRNYRGDIELHLRDDGWYQHGHHTDKSYNQVILHIALHQESQKITINKENGQQPFKAYFDHHDPDIFHKVRAIDISQYSTQTDETIGHCSKHLFQKISEKETKDLFRSAAYWRLEKKLHFLVDRCAKYPSAQFAAGFAMALGYRHNGREFFELFLHLLHYRDLPREELLAIALGCCGFLEQGRKASWALSSYYQYLQKLWFGKQDQIVHQTTLRLDHIRPLHHPIRRLAFLTHLLHDPFLEQFWFYHIEIWEKKKNCLKSLQEDFLKAIPCYRDPYWEYHFTFESQPQQKKLSWIGEDIKMHVLINTVLPLLYGRIKESNDDEQMKRFEEFYSSLRVSYTSKSAYLEKRFFGNLSNEKILQKAQIAQGAYQIHHDFCTQFETSCAGCPFVDRYLENNKPKRTVFRDGSFSY